MHQFGTAGGVGGLDLDGILPTRNFRDGSFEEAQNITGQTMANTILVNRGTCYSCGVACKREVEVRRAGRVGQVRRHGIRDHRCAGFVLRRR